MAVNSTVPWNNTALFLILTVLSLSLSFLSSQSTDHLGIEFMGKKAFLFLHLHHDCNITCFLLDKHSTAYITWNKWLTWMYLMALLHYTIWQRNTKPSWNTNSIYINVHFHNRSHQPCMLYGITLKYNPLLLSLSSLHTYIFLYLYCLHHFYLYTFFPSCTLSLFLSLTIAYEVSLQNTNVLQSPWKQWEQRGGQGAGREIFCDVGTVTKCAPH